MYYVWNCSFFWNLHMFNLIVCLELVHNILLCPIFRHIWHGGISTSNLSKFVEVVLKDFHNKRFIYMSLFRYEIFWRDKNCPKEKFLMKSLSSFWTLFKSFLKFFLVSRQEKWSFKILSPWSLILRFSSFKSFNFPFKIFVLFKFYVKFII